MTRLLGSLGVFAAATSCARLIAGDQAVLASQATERLAAPDAYKVQQELKRAEIVPTVIDDFLPSLTLLVEWPSDHSANLGNTVKVKHVQDEPAVSLRRIRGTDTDFHASNTTYAITLTDPDAPSRDNPKWAEMCHFIATGVGRSSGTSIASSSIQLSDLQDIMPYKPPGPPPKTGKHRYVFLVFVPANGTTEPLNITKPGDRQHWGTGKERHGVRDWAQANGLIPVAANFIYAQDKKQ